MQLVQDWELMVRGREVTARVVLDGPGRGLLTSLYVMYGPSQTGLAIAVADPQDAQAEIDEFLSKLAGGSW